MECEPTYADVLAARELLAARLPVTPMWSYPALDHATGATVFVKHENVQPIGAFKVRGGLTLLAGMTPAQRAEGLVTYSTGNHAQSLAYACAAYGAPCTVVMPSSASAEKVRAVRALGASAVLHGADMAEAQERAEKLAADGGCRLVSPGDTPALLAGVGTAYVEIFEARRGLDAVVVPVGSGTGAAAAGIVAAELAPGCRVIAVQSSAAPAAHDSWRAGGCVERPDRTAAEGLATGRGFVLPQRLLRTHLAEFRLVSDEQIFAAQRLLASHAHTLAEGAGAAGLAAVLADPEGFAGQRVAVVCTGGNASAAEIAALGGGAGPVR
ncbi:pyridoxal-phosphate dependent enzyme [Streptomyces sp. HNM0663]|uniref:Pyridoxal-phosphate dependent enzyme n=1 Tax=Streptomyces chengmaiensis TaxID=3040919 RepID=A0ABT6HUW1_9ACTN|nr:pyridoxal-phosphate dependent enzyme [Streptomyces chengmaiensis]MDH2392504.1 pyridoxal-phosphate dependent enzyme [Streptomyces chengmaiensis]